MSPLETLSNKNYKFLLVKSFSAFSFNEIFLVIPSFYDSKITGSPASPGRTLLILRGKKIRESFRMHPGQLREIAGTFPKLSRNYLGTIPELV